MRYRELVESRSAPLYHIMEFKKAISVFEADMMPARWEHLVPKIGKLLGNSFTRNKEFKNRLVRITVDQARLAHTHRIIPVDGERIFMHTTKSAEDPTPERGELSLGRRGDRDMNTTPLAEEFVVGDIKQLHRFITKIEIGTPNFSVISGANAIHLLETTQAYAAKYGIELVVSQRFIDNVEEIKQRWADEAAEDELDEMAPTDQMRSTTFYHGTGGTVNAKAIMKQGLKGRETQGKSHLAPVAGKAYLSQDLRYAIIYALGGDYLGHATPKFATESGDPYGYLFVVKGDSLETAQPDEDSVGQFLYDFYHKSKDEQMADPHGVSVATFIAQSVTDGQRRAIRDGEYSYFAAGGKRALKKMPDWIKEYLIKHGAHVAATGKLMPSEVWRIDRRKSDKLAKDGSNFFEIAKRVK
jgi:hypothetical protein